MKLFSDVSQLTLIQVILVCAVLNIVICLPISIYLLRPHLIITDEHEHSTTCADGTDTAVDISVGFLATFTILGYIANGYVYQVLVNILCVCYMFCLYIYFLLDRLVLL